MPGTSAGLLLCLAPLPLFKLSGYGTSLLVRLLAKLSAYQCLAPALFLIAWTSPPSTLSTNLIILYVSPCLSPCLSPFPFFLINGLYFHFVLSVLAGQLRRPWSGPNRCASATSAATAVTLLRLLRLFVAMLSIVVFSPSAYLMPTGMEIT